MNINAKKDETRDDKMDIITIIKENALTVRCLPKTTTSLYAYKEGQKLKDNQKIVLLPKGGNRKFIKETNTVEKGGWWYVKETQNTSSTVRFSRKNDKFFAPTLEKAIQLYLNGKKP